MKTDEQVHNIYCEGDDSRSPESFLPSDLDTFQILVSLADRDCPGYSILRDIEERTGDV
jgi:hypothetical protein